MEIHHILHDAYTKLVRIINQCDSLDVCTVVHRIFGILFDCWIFHCDVLVSVIDQGRAFWIFLLKFIICGICKFLVEFIKKGLV